MTGDQQPDESAGPPDRVLLQALEFAVGVAAAGAKLRPAMPFPSELRPFLRFQRLPARALADVRRAVERDDVFRKRLAAAAVPELVDEPGMLWLRRPEGWEELIAALAGPADDADLAAQLKRSERRREAAEQAARRAIAELAAVRADHERRTDEASSAAAAGSLAQAEIEALKRTSDDQQRSIQRLRQQLADAEERVLRLEAELVDEGMRADDAERVRDHALATRAAGDRSGADEGFERAASIAAALATQSAQARSMADELQRLARGVGAFRPAPPSRAAPAAAPRRPRAAASRRRPIALPGGIYGSSADAAEFLVRHAGVVVVVDGYNVAKLGWPTLALEDQRERCLAACEDVTRRFGTDVVVVFDGASVPGAAATGRRLVRVRFSPEGVSADDVIRAEVGALADQVPVVVVTNDQEIIGDMRAVGANTIASEQLLGLARR